MAVALQKDPTILALPTMTSVLEFQVKRLENERTKAEKIFNETLQQQQATVNSQQACIAQLKAENLTLRHQSETKIESLQAKIENFRAALKETLGGLHKVNRNKRFDELTPQERCELNKDYQNYKKWNPRSSQGISSAEVFYFTNYNNLPLDDDEPCSYGRSRACFLYVEEPHPLYIKYGPLVEKK